jgi:hypothetical protein
MVKESTNKNLSHSTSSWARRGKSLERKAVWVMGEGPDYDI